MSIAPILGSSSLWPWPLKNKASGRFQRFERKVWSITVLTETMVPERYFGHDVSETRGISEATRVCKTTVRKLLLFWKLFDHFSETTLASEAVSRTLYLHIYIYIEILLWIRALGETRQFATQRILKMLSTVNLESGSSCCCELDHIAKSSLISSCSYN